MRTKIEKLLMICLMAFGSFLIMMSLVSHNAEAVSEWSIETVDSDGSIGLYSSIAIDSNNHPRISYFDDTNDDLKFAYWNGLSWQIETVDSDGSVGLYSSIAIDLSDNVHISHGKFNELKADWNLNYTTNASGKWTMETVDSGGSIGWFPSIAIDSSDNVHISYSDGDNEDLKYTTDASGEWVAETVDSDGSVGWFPSIAIDSNNHPHISYFDDTNDSLKYVKAGPDTDDDTGWTCFIATAAFGSSMEPHVKILRDFRDRFLLHNSVGKGFMRLYYTYSPPMADFITEHDSLRAVVSVSLLPVVGVSWVVLKIGPASTMALMLLLISGFIGFVRFRRKYKI